MSNDVILKAVLEMIDPSDKVDTTYIELVCRQMLSNGELLNRVDTQIEKVLSENIMSIAMLVDIMSVLPIVVQIIQKFVELSKTMKLNEMKYLFFCLVYRWLMKNEPAFLYEISPYLENIYLSTWKLICIVPDAIKVIKNIGSGCCGFRKPKTQPY